MCHWLQVFQIHQLNISQVESLSNTSNLAVNQVFVESVSRGKQESNPNTDQAGRAGQFNSLFKDSNQTKSSNIQKKKKNKQGQGGKIEAKVETYRKFKETLRTN